MKPEDKAKELIDRFLEETPVKDFSNLTVKESSDELLRDLNVAKQCALICVDNEHKSNLALIESLSDYLPTMIETQAIIDCKKEFELVKEAINK